MWRLVLALMLFASPALAASYTDCSGTVGTNSTAITFPSSGNHGPPKPTQFLLIINSAGTNKLAINANGAAVIDGSGSLPMDAVGAGWLWNVGQGVPPPPAVNIIASSSSTPYTCLYN